MSKMLILKTEYRREKLTQSLQGFSFFASDITACHLRTCYSFEKQQRLEYELQRRLNSLQSSSANLPTLWIPIHISPESIDRLVGLG